MKTRKGQCTEWKTASLVFPRYLPSSPHSERRITFLGPYRCIHIYCTFGLSKILRDKIQPFLVNGVRAHMHLGCIYRVRRIYSRSLAWPFLPLCFPVTLGRWLSFSLIYLDVNRCICMHSMCVHLYNGCMVLFNIFASFYMRVWAKCKI